MPLTDNERATRVGRLTLLKEQQERLRILIDTLAKDIVTAFDPMDIECTYADNINVTRLEIGVNQIRKYVKDLKKLNEEIVVLQSKLGEN
jgi:hypothetical protein